MKVLLAGYNIDSSLINSLKSNTATPEVISAAYARISRSTKSADALRLEALGEIDKARSSNSRIIFEMGHASVAEHAVFNIDIVGISRYLTELVQRSRLASFTEKSQRYVTFTRDYIVPSELGTYPKLKKAYKASVDPLFEEYESSYKLLLEHYRKTIPKLGVKDREALAKEDARYILPLATKTQMGLTINARSLETLLRRLAKSPLAEAQQLKDELYAAVQPVTPSLIRHFEPDGFSGAVNLEKVGFTGFMQQELPWVEALDLETKLRLVHKPTNPDDTILAAIIYQQGELNYETNLDTVSKLPKAIKRQLWNQVFTHLKPWHKLPRAFEMAEFGFEITMSESCWAQFKRHRFCTTIRKGSAPTTPKFPDIIRQIKRTGRWEVLCEAAQNWGYNLHPDLNFLAPYTRLNASVMTVYVKMNLREIYHFVRLRADEHAQWEIREIAREMVRIVRNLAPQAAAWLCGKSEFNGVNSL